jgi:hypothetical protein
MKRTKVIRERNLLKRIEQTLINSGFHLPSIPEWLENNSQKVVKELCDKREIGRLLKLKKYIDPSPEWAIYDDGIWF